MFTRDKAEKLLHEVKARIGDYTATIDSLEFEALTLETICDKFDWDSPCEPDYQIASRISFYTTHVMDGAKHLRKMSEWYEHRLEIEERKLAKLRAFLKDAAAPDYYSQTWAVDFDIYHADSDLTDRELADFANKLREALTADDNTGVVSYEACYITVYGNAGGDNKRLAELLKEMYEHGCWCEVRDEETDELIQILSFGLNDLVGLRAE